MLQGTLPGLQSPTSASGSPSEALSEDTCPQRPQGGGHAPWKDPREHPRAHRPQGGDLLPVMFLLDPAWGQLPGTFQRVLQPQLANSWGGPGAAQAGFSAGTPWKVVRGSRLATHQAAAVPRTTDDHSPRAWSPSFLRSVWKVTASPRARGI